MLEPQYSNQATKFLKNTDKILAKRIIQKVEELQENPVIHDTKTIQGYTDKVYRVRVGDYRILYEIDYPNKILGIIKIDKRLSLIHI